MPCVMRLLKNLGTENCESFRLLVSYAGYRRDEGAGILPATEEQRSQQTKGQQPGEVDSKTFPAKPLTTTPKTQFFSLWGFSTVS